MEDFKLTLHSKDFQITVEKDTNNENEIVVSGLDLSEIRTLKDLETVKELLDDVIDELSDNIDIVHEEEEFVGPCWIQ